MFLPGTMPYHWHKAMFFRPDLVWKLTERWKSYRADEPSDLYRVSTKVGGAAFALVGLAALLLPFILK